MTIKANNKSSKSWEVAQLVTPPPVRIIESESIPPKIESDLEELVASMQTIRSKVAVKAAFKASPARLGRAAVKHARKKASRPSIVSRKSSIRD